MTYSLAEIFTKDGRRQLSPQAKGIFSDTFNELNKRAKGRSLVASPQGIIEANGKVYILIDYLYRGKVNPSDEFLRTTERQGRVFELQLNATSNNYNAILVYKDKWEASWVDDGAGGRHLSTDNEGTSRGLISDHDSRVEIYGSNGLSIMVDSGNKNSRNELILNSKGLSSANKSGFKDAGRIEAASYDSYYGYIIATSSYSGGDDRGNIYWPEYNVVIENSPSASTHTFPKSQALFQSDTIVSKGGDIYTLLESFTPPPDWNPLGQDAYSKVKNIPVLARISKNGTIDTVELPGINSQSNPPDASYIYYQYDLANEGGSNIWLIETENELSNNRATAIGQRAWRIETFFRDRDPTPDLSYKSSIPSSFNEAWLDSPNASNTHLFQIMGPSTGMLATFSEEKTVVDASAGIYRHVSEFLAELYSSDNSASASPPKDSSKHKVNSFATSLVLEVLSGSTHLLTGNSYEWKFYNIGEGRYGVQQKGKNTIDEITGVTSLKFQDQTITIGDDVAATFNKVKGIDDVSGVVFRLYNAAFSRLPDANGLQNWINGNAAGTVTYASSAQSFSESQEFKNRYGSNVTDTQFITTLYNNVLGRAPDAGGLSHYQSLLAGGRSRGALLLDFSESPENRVLFTQVTGLA